MSRTQRQVHGDDRGLAAVARVREVRETDSRIGLQRVLAEEVAVRARLGSLEAGIASAPVPAVTTAAELVSARTRLAHVGILVGETRKQAATAEVVTADTRARWGADRARLAAVEHLLERRAARRRTEAERRAARDADDLAAQRWARGAR
ncbi:flagellar FliJ family protein [Nocardioides daeguensis]|uniref:Flagellar FliJ protein n=1 Tax=Nocardioides daeguensis TaxID=908359 RepID=A0ABP6VCC5_9ACTN|nr:flagellar FliJ family protein [Nocardioides daeguensis]MBV6726127.1 flagellar FliJ family protein [Nocardioides daeguensis]MCR1771970.1 flagellar FliJ family protein [Nocardioides daeguensis]